MTVQGQLFGAGITERGNELQIDTPRLLFNANIGAIGTRYDVSADFRGATSERRIAGAVEPDHELGGVGEVENGRQGSKSGFLPRRRRSEGRFLRKTARRQFFRG
jgi:hypothetical protein